MPLRVGDVAIVGLEPPSQEIEQRGFARAVGADEADTVAGFDAEGDAVRR